MEQNNFNTVKDQFWRQNSMRQALIEFFVLFSLIASTGGLNERLIPSKGTKQEAD